MVMMRLAYVLGDGVVCVVMSSVRRAAFIAASAQGSEAGAGVEDPRVVGEHDRRLVRRPRGRLRPSLSPPEQLQGL